MSRPQGTLEIAVRVVFVVLLGFLVLAQPVLFLIFFVPIAAWLIWRIHDKNAELEKRLAALEKQEPKSEEA